MSVLSKIRLETIKDSNRLAFKNLFNLYQHDLAEFVPDLYPAVDEEGYYDKTSTTKILAASS